MPRPNQDSLPSICEFLEEDRNAYENKWVDTGFPTAELPPMVTTNFLANDTGNSNPKFIRSSIYQVPSNEDMIKKASFPFTLSITPFAELDPQELTPPIVNLGEHGPPRCQQCRAYISPFFEFLDGGMTYRCPFCQTSTPVQQTYFAHLNFNGCRTDIDCRPELRLGSYEFVATKEYCVNQQFPEEPAFVFLIDVSYQSVNSGLLNLLCENLPYLLENLPRECDAPKSAIKIALATYSQTIHFYDLLSNDRSHMSVVTDVEDVFVPFINGFFVDYEVAKDNLKRCLNDIRATFLGTNVAEVILGPAIDISLKALSAAKRNGKIFVFHTNLPTFEAPGRLKNREDRNLAGTEKEKTLLIEATDYYKKLGKECVEAGVCVDLFLFPNAYVDIASIAPISRLTGGSIYKYPYFNAQKDGRQFLMDLHRDISRPIGFNVKVRVRTLVGIRPTGFYGAFFMDNVTDMQMGAMDCDKSIQVEIKYDDNLNEKERVYIQVATLFTSCSGQRRVRIHNLTLPVTSDYNIMYGFVDQFTVFVYMLKQAEATIHDKTWKQMRVELVNRSAQILASYRENCSENALYGQLILPEGLKILPLIGNCILRSEALAGGTDITVDDRAFLLHLIPSMRVDEVVHFLYPTILPLTSLAVESPDQQFNMPSPVRASVEFLKQDEAYIIDNGLLCFIWIGPTVASDWLREVFGVQSLNHLDTRSITLPARDNPHSRSIHQVLAHLNHGRSRRSKLLVVKPGDACEGWMKKFLVENRYGENLDSYSEFLCRVHQEVIYIIY